MGFLSCKSVTSCHREDEIAFPFCKPVTGCHMEGAKGEREREEEDVRTGTLRPWVLPLSGRRKLALIYGCAVDAF